MSAARPFGIHASRAAIALMSVAIAFSSSSYAQDADATEEASSDDNVIIVSAQKRDQNILDVPAAISAVGQDVLQAAQVDRFTELTAISPSLTITTSGNRNQNPIFLRGIGTFSFSTAAEPAVLVMIDDVPLLLPGQALSNFADVARIEVLRG
ncbi:MAG: TonB-dependent receptor plug domain-containing protein, partial [Rhizobium oryzihabitans]